ncbi:MAG: hypothetical protein JJU13_08435 [Balneolaceae bacterium]|nr:hypothetical protein [Balneolaceae bacterium]
MNLLKNNIISIASAMFVFMFFLIGNSLRDTPRTLSTIPDGVIVLSIFLVLIFFIWKKHKENRSVTFRDLLGYGEKISRKSAIIFSVLCALYAFYFFGYLSTLIAFAFMTALFSFYFIGLVTSLIIGKKGRDWLFGISRTKIP